MLCLILSETSLASTVQLRTLAVANRALCFADQALADVWFWPRNEFDLALGGASEIVRLIFTQLQRGFLLVIVFVNIQQLHEQCLMGVVRSHHEIHVHVNGSYGLVQCALTSKAGGVDPARLSFRLTKLQQPQVNDLKISEQREIERLYRGNLILYF